MTKYANIKQNMRSTLLAFKSNNNSTHGIDRSEEEKKDEVSVVIVN